jgi:hypothetical protein
VYGSLIVAASVFIVLFDDVAKSDSFPGTEITGMSRLPERNRCGQEALGFEAGVDGFLTSTIFPPSRPQIIDDRSSAFANQGPKSLLGQLFSA